MILVTDLEIVCESVLRGHYRRATANATSDVTAFICRFSRGVQCVVFVVVFVGEGRGSGGRRAARVFSRRGRHQWLVHKIG